MLGWYLGPLKKYAVFKGRASRKEYWMFYLFNFGIDFVIGFIESILMEVDQIDSLFGIVYRLAVLIPTVAVGVRRMHDTGRSGWWILLPIVNFIFLVTDSQQGENKYGANPKDAISATSVDSVQVAADKIRELANLKEEGVLSPEEFEIKKADLLEKF